MLDRSARATADISGLLGQAVVAPWDAKPRVLEDGGVGEGPADDRPAETIAAEIVRTVPEHDDGDGSTPSDPDENLRSFVEAVTAAGAGDGGWLGGAREYISDAGPVPSSRFL